MSGSGMGSLKTKEEREKEELKKLLKEAVQYIEETMEGYNEHAPWCLHTELNPFSVGSEYCSCGASNWIKKRDEFIKGNK